MLPWTDELEARIADALRTGSKPEPAPLEAADCLYLAAVLTAIAAAAILLN